MRARTVALLFVAAVLLSGYVYFFERDAAPWDTAIGPVFPGLQYVDLEEIEIQHGAFAQAPGLPAGPIFLKREKGGERLWWIEKPHVPAYNPRAESIGFGLAELQNIADVPPVGEAQVFDPRGPEVSVRFRTRSGEEHRLEVGKDHPDLDLVYLRLDRARLFLTRSAFRKNLSAGLDDLRGRALFPVPRDRVVTLEVSGDPKYEKVVERQAGKQDWRFRSPQPAPGSREAIGRALDELNSWRAETFVRDEEGDLAPYGLDRPRTTIAVIDLNGKRTALQVGTDAPEKGQVYVKWADQPMVMTALAGPAEALERPAERLYSEFVLQLGAEEIVEISVTVPSPSVPPEGATVPSPPVPPEGARGGSKGAEDFTIRRAASAAPPGAAPKGVPPRKGASAAQAPGEWKVETAGGAGFEGDLDRIRVVVDGLSHLLVKRYLPPRNGTPGGKPPDLKVEILAGSGLRWPLLIGSPDSPQEAADKICYASVEGEPFSFQVISTIPDDLRQGPLYFRNRRISALKPEDLREFEVSLAGPQGVSSWVLGKPAEFWQLHAGDQFQLKNKNSIDENLVRKVVRLLGREEFRVDEWMPGETDFAAREIASERFRVRISFFELGSDFTGFQRLFLGARQGASGAQEATWGRCDAPGLRDLPFLVDQPTAAAILDLVEHLQAVTEPSR